MTTADILDAIAAAAAQATDPEGAVTMQELRAANPKLSVRRILTALHQLAAEKRLTACRVQRSDITGRVQLVPAYVVLKRATTSVRQ